MLVDVSGLNPKPAYGICEANCEHFHCFFFPFLSFVLFFLPQKTCALLFVTICFWLYTVITVLISMLVMHVCVSFVCDVCIAFVFALQQLRLYCRLPMLPPCKIRAGNRSSCARSFFPRSYPLKLGK